MNIESINKKLSFRQLVDEFKNNSELKNSIKLKLNEINKSINKKFKTIDESKNNSTNNNIKIYRFNNIKKLNAMTTDFILELYEIVENFDQNIIYIFIGEYFNKIFCVGADLKNFYNMYIENNIKAFFTFSNMSSYVFYKFYEKTHDKNNSIFKPK
jgi:hypothetical protein